MKRIMMALRVLFGIKRKYQKREPAIPKKRKCRFTYYQRRKASERMSEQNRKRWALMKKLGAESQRLLSDADLVKIELQRGFGNNETNENGN